MSISFYTRPRRAAYREPPPYQPGEILLRVVAFAVLAATAFLVFRAFAG